MPYKSIPKQPVSARGTLWILYLYQLVTGKGAIFTVDFPTSSRWLVEREREIVNLSVIRGTSKTFNVCLAVLDGAMHAKSTHHFPNDDRHGGWFNMSRFGLLLLLEGSRKLKINR